MRNDDGGRRRREPFSWLMEFCEPTASQEEELASCPFAREFEDFEAWSPSLTTSSPSTPVSPILLVSLPTSPDECAAEEGAAFPAPPEHHEGPNPSDSCAGQVGAPEAERARAVAGEESDGEIEVVEIEVGEGVGRTKVFSEDELVVASILDEWNAENMAAAAARREIEGSMNSGVAELDAIGGNHDLGGEIENAEGIGGGKPSDSSGSSSSCEIVGEKSCRTELDGVEKDVGIAKSAEEIAKDGKSCEIVGDDSCEVVETAKDGHGNGGVGSNDKRIERTVGRKRKLPPSFNGKQKDDAGESSEEQSRSPPSINGEHKDAGECSEEKEEDVEEERLDFLDLLRLHFKRQDEDDDDEDYIETAKQRGMKIVKSRSWE